MIDTGVPRLGDAKPPARGFPGHAAAWWQGGKQLAFRFRLLGCCLLLAALPFATAPGDIISDTKFELVVNPNSFLSGALTLWNPQQFGGLLDQAVGYLFPMGPFFEIGHILAVDGWIIQRLWIALLLIAAFGGTVRLAGRMGVGTPWTRLAAGLTYALSPAVLSILGQMSGEVLQMTMLPWILIPLADMRPWTRDASGGRGRSGIGGILAAPGASRARAVARSATAVALCSGMNAASTIAVLVPAVIYILTRRGGVSRLRMLAWWVPAVVLVTLSWFVPLLLLSKYGVSIVLYTESGQVTSSATSLLNIFRGTENWVSYLVVNGQSWRPLALQIATDLVPAFLIGLLAALGLAGLLRRDIPERRFLLWSALLGIVIIALGYVSSLGSPLESPIISFINGPASPFRNLWKFDPMLRLPLALGLAHLLLLPGGRPPGDPPRSARAYQLKVALTGLAGAALAGLLVPAFATGVASAGPFRQVPSYWVATADWLNAHAGRQAVLVEPGAAFGQYIWGSPMDDVLQPLTNVDYAERNLSTIGSAGNERLLDAIDQRLTAGAGSAGITRALARMGVKYVVVRNDLSRAELNGAWPARISDALAASPGITQVAQFGPMASGGGPDDAATNFDAPYPAVQVYQVAGTQPVAVVQDASSALRVYGAPESLITLASEGLLGNRPVLFNDDSPDQPVAGDVMTDSLRRRVVNFGQLRANYSPTLTATQPADTFLATNDFTEPGWSKYQAVARYAGIKDVTASSSASDLGALPTQWASGAMPYSAVDGNLATMWQSGGWTGPIGQWIQVDFDARMNPGTIQVAFADNAAIGPPVTGVTVTTAAGRVSDQVQVTGNLQPLRVPAGPSGWLRITVTSVDYRPASPFGTQVGIAGIVVPGVSATRTIVTPPVPGGDPSAVVLSKAQPQPSGCMLTSLRWVCSSQLSTTTEEQYGFDQTFKEPYNERTVVRGSAILINPSLADHYAQVGTHETVVTGSSIYTADVPDQPRSAFDGDPATSWVASTTDSHPRLSIQWGYSRKISQVTIQRPAGASGLLQVLITGSGGQIRGGMIGANGAAAGGPGRSDTVKFPPMKTTGLTFSFSPVQAPLQITDVSIPGVPFLTTPSGPFRLPCGFGPLVRLNGQAVPTKVTGTFGDLLAGRPMTYTSCQPVSLAAGDNEVTESQVDSFDIQDMVLGGSALAATSAPAPSPADVVSWTSSVRKLRVATTARSYLVVNQNFNTGWRAVIDGQRLEPVRLDGWKQAWVLPAHTAGVVTLTYQPEAVYRDAVIVGLAALAVVLLVASGLRWPWRRRPAAIGPRLPQARRSYHPRPWPHELSSSEALLPLWPYRFPWLRWVGLAAACAVLAGVGLVLGGYPGAVLVPAAALAFGVRAGGWRVRSRPWVLAGLLVIASACGAVGVHLALSGDIGSIVSAPSNAIPQVICLIVVGGMAGALIGPGVELNRDKAEK
ncbi:MAG: DUF3367 domain-containing protein [Streptosporangiaceae bacterium]|nr:DUF3367 domain-containing protein [Streptosporangiaceae bacterium]